MTLPIIHRESPVFAQALGLRCESAGPRTKAGRTSALTLSTALTETEHARFDMALIPDTPEIRAAQESRA